jgi:hypothetical protein
LKLVRKNLRGGGESVEGSKSDKITIDVKPVDGEATSLEVEGTDTIEAVKTHIRIHSITDVPVDQQRLSFNGKELENGRTLFEYNIQNGSTLYLSMRMRGGGESKDTAPVPGRTGRCIESHVKPQRKAAEEEPRKKSKVIRLTKAPWGAGNDSQTNAAGRFITCHQCWASILVPPDLTPGEAGGDEADGDVDPEEHASDDDMDGGMALDPSQPFQIGGGVSAFPASEFPAFKFPALEFPAFKFSASEFPAFKFSASEFPAFKFSASESEPVCARTAGQRPH